jgi:PleD family two-component response regulator
MVTIGVAGGGLEAPTPEFSTLLGLADQGLYRAKHGGRNRVAVIQQAELEQRT